MATIVAVWPNNTTSVVVMEGSWKPIDLFYELDHVGDPVSAKVWVLKRHHGEAVHVTTDWTRGPKPEPNMDVSGTHDAADTSERVGPKSHGVRVSLAGDSGSMKRFNWPPNILRQFLFASWKDRVNQPGVSEAILSAECGRMLAEIPAPPPPLHAAKDVNKMEPFAGVYVSWNDDGTAHYVGESINVPSRVQASRPEIGDRMIGVVACDKNERLRIEALYIGLLNPAGNSQSLERAAARDSARARKTG
jgi:hypothetical protein